MGSDISRVQYNTRERLTSTDLNANIAYQHQSLQSAMQALLAPDYEQSGVITGFDVSVDAGSRVVAVTAGLGLIKDTSVVDPQDSVHRWVQLLDTASVTVPAASGEPRWDVVEILPGTAAAVTEVRDEWDPGIPPDGGFAPETFDKLILSQATVQIRQGPDRPGGFGQPYFPNGVAGALPLAYVFVDDDGSVLELKTGIVMCRPILRSPSAMDVQREKYIGLDPFTQVPNNRSWVQGGGMRVEMNTPRPAHAVGRFSMHGMAFSIGPAALGTLGNSTAGGTAISTDEMAYVYALPPPYPAGYDAPLAPREIVVGTGIDNKFVAADHQFLNCIVVVDPVPPVYTGQGTPTPIGSSSGATTLHDWPFRADGNPATIQREHYVYLGAFQKRSSGGYEQKIDGPRVILTERRPILNLAQLDTGTYDPRGTNWPTSKPADAVGKIPPFIFEMDGVFTMTITSAAAPPNHEIIRVEVSDDEDVLVGLEQSPKMARALNVDSGSPFIAFPMTIRDQFNPTFTVYSNPTDPITLRWTTTSYVDPILAGR